MKIIDKADVIDVIDELIDGYSNETLDHTVTSCPLCKACRYNNSCNNCLNIVFYVGSGAYFDCTQRCQTYTKLDYTYDDSEEAEDMFSTYENTHRNDANLAKFWSEVRGLVKLSSEADVLNMSDDFKSKMLEIAEKYR